MLEHRDRRRDDDPGRKSARRYAVVIQAPLDYVACLRAALAARLRRAPCQQHLDDDHDRCQ